VIDNIDYEEWRTGNFCHVRVTRYYTNRNYTNKIAMATQAFVTSRLIK